MTFDDDLMVLNFGTEKRMVNCKRNGIEWPPPERFIFAGTEFKRVRMSTLTDEQRAGMTHVFRGAEYRTVEGGQQ